MFHKRLIRSFTLFALFAFCSIYTQQFCHRHTDGFSITKIRSKLAYHPEWAVAPLAEEDQESVNHILNQKFSYLAKGAQCHVFESADRKWVLKFMRYNHMRPPFWITALPSFLDPWRSNKIEKKWSKLYKDFASYTLAYNELHEKTGILFLHLNKTDHLNKTVTIVDKIGIEHPLNMDGMEFILQKKATLVYPAIDAWMKKGNLIAAKKGLCDLVAVLNMRFEKGIYDKDPDLNTNFGFIDGRAVQIDVGRFKHDLNPKNLQMKRETIFSITDNLKQYLDRRYPELSDLLHKEITKL